MVKAGAKICPTELKCDTLDLRLLGRVGWQRQPPIVSSAWRERMATRTTIWSLIAPNCPLEAACKIADHILPLTVSIARPLALWTLTQAALFCSLMQASWFLAREKSMPLSREQGLISICSLALECQMFDSRSILRTRVVFLLSSLALRARRLA